MEDKEFNKLIASEQAVCGADYAELGTAVQLVADILLGLRQAQDELLGKYRTLGQEVILLGCLLVDGLGL